MDITQSTHTHLSTGDIHAIAGEIYDDQRIWLQEKLFLKLGDDTVPDHIDKLLHDYIYTTVNQRLGNHSSNDRSQLSERLSQSPRTLKASLYFFSDAIDGQGWADHIINSVNKELDEQFGPGLCFSFDECVNIVRLVQTHLSRRQDCHFDPNCEAAYDAIYATVANKLGAYKTPSQIIEMKAGLDRLREAYGSSTVPPTTLNKGLRLVADLADLHIEKIYGPQIQR